MPRAGLGSAAMHNLVDSSRSRIESTHPIPRFHSRAVRSLAARPMAFSCFSTSLRARCSGTPTDRPVPGRCEIRRRCNDSTLPSRPSIIATAGNGITSREQEWSMYSETEFAIFCNSSHPSPYSSAGRGTGSSSAVLTPYMSTLNPAWTRSAPAVRPGLPCSARA